MSGDAQAPSGCAVNVVDDTTSVCLMLKGVLDPVKEAAKLKDKQVRILLPVVMAPAAQAHAAKPGYLSCIAQPAQCHLLGS